MFALGRSLPGWLQSLARVLHRTYFRLDQVFQVADLVLQGVKGMVKGVVTFRTLGHGPSMPPVLAALPSGARRPYSWSRSWAWTRAETRWSTCCAVSPD